MMPSPVICPDCKLELDLETMGVHVLRTRSQDQIPYSLYKADAYSCSGCGYGVLAAFGQAPYLTDADESRLLAEVALLRADYPELLFEWHEKQR